MPQIIIIIIFTLLTGASAAAQVTTVPEQLGLDPFYKKYVSLQKLPVVSSQKVSDRALLRARSVVKNMVAKRKSLLKALIDNNVRVVVMATSENTTDIPEHSDLTPKDYWDKRARGLGATHARPVSSCAEENVLGYSGDPYKGESILIHEFAHTLHEMAIVDIDKDFEEKLKQAYDVAIKGGLWKDTYAATNYKEYWAEGVQSWFNANKAVPAADGVHNQINTRSELMMYDPKLATLISEWFMPLSKIH